MRLISNTTAWNARCTVSWAMVNAACFPRAIGAAVLVGACACACACAKTRPAAPVGVSTVTSAADRSRPRAQLDAGTRGTGPVMLGGEVRQACSLPDLPEEAPKFDFDSARLSGRGEILLAGVADCVKNGRLGGAKIHLVGFTDPRGPEGYNAELGLARAEAARNWLIELGVPSDRIVTSSRGEEDARGADRAAWRRERRVEVHLDAAAPPRARTSTPIGRGAR